MSKYTSEIRFICENLSGLSSSKGGSDIEKTIANARSKVFDFNYPIFDEAYRSVLETKILKHFYTREIGFETYGLWKFKLNVKLNEIMKYYNQLYKSELIEFNPMYGYEHSKDYNRKGGGNNQTSGNNSSKNTNTTNTAGSSKQLYSDTPQGALNGIDAENYLTSATKNMQDATDTTITDGSGTNSSTGKFDNTEDYLEHAFGRNDSGSSLLIEYRKTFLNIDMMIIEELEELFLHLW